MKSLLLIFFLCIYQIIGYQSNKGDRYRPSTHSPGSILFTKYLKFDEIVDYLSSVSRKSGGLAKVQTIGKTSAGRPLQVMKICRQGCGRKPIIFIDCGIHAREWLSPAMCLYIIHQLVENRVNADMLDQTDWYIIPAMNPDGYEYSHSYERMWRKNRSRGGTCSGVDLNRNFGFHWDESGTSRDSCSEIYSGPESFSENETRAFRTFVQSNKRNMKLYLTFHSYGQYILFPWGYANVVPQDAAELEALGRDVAESIEAVRGTKYTVGPSSITLYPAAGGSDDWIKAKAGVHLAYTIELPGGGENGFDAPSRMIKGVVTETFEGIRVYQKYIAKKYDP